MKFSINQTELQTALNTVQKGVATRSTLPVLSGIYVVAHGDEITFQTTNLELSIQFTCAALVEEEGKAVLPGKLICDIVFLCCYISSCVCSDSELAHCKLRMMEQDIVLDILAVLFFCVEVCTTVINDLSAVKYQFQVTELQTIEIYFGNMKHSAGSCKYR